MEISKTFRFEASHVLPKHPGKCSRLHGHSWVLTVSIQGPINEETGFVMDFAELSQVVKEIIINRIDHRHLGAWPQADLPWFHAWAVKDMPRDLYPTSENLLWWIGRELDGLDWNTLALEETCTSSAILTREEFDAAQKGEE